ncbi:hypothetical protein OSB04_003406 [Centaurea solstitialis]|uniref:Reverse transcriptase Ty1/copia-type domain-containing protein n=1 Tax=Centaurea solstitialis TaxID=347529 RepID=A0AA38WTQ9_9ASTR|nr:hypothetical protein OSB04_003406 [Centaurea solstitialis]
MDAYCQEIKVLADQLNNVDAPVDEQDLVLQTIAGLTEQYETVGTILQNTKPLPSFFEVRSQLCMNETTKANQALHSSQQAATALHVQSQTRSFSANPNTTASQTTSDTTRGRGRSRGRGRGRSSTSQPTRSRGQPNYPAQSQHPYIIFPNNWATTQWASLLNNTYSPQSNQTPPCPYPSTPRPNGSHGILGPRPAQAHMATYSPTPTDIAQALYTLSMSQPSDPVAYMDTGASGHMEQPGMTSPFIFNTCTNKQIIVGNGTTIPVIGQGNKTLPPPFPPLKLNNILYAPNLIKNLISVRRLTTDNLLSIEFDPFGFLVKDLKTKEPILRCNSSGDLYPLTTNFIKPPSKPIALAAVTQDRWHQRLGHPGKSLLHSLKSSSFIDFSKPNNTLCQSCVFGKSVKLPFYDSMNKTHLPFDIIHSDLWTSPVLSTGGHRYYILFLDDLTDFLWTYPLTNKSQFEESIYPFSIQHSNTTLDYTFLSPPFNPLLWDNVRSSKPTAPPNAPHPTSLGPTPTGPTASHQPSPSPHQPSRTASLGPTPAPLAQTLSPTHSPPSPHPSDPAPNTHTPPQPSPQPTPPHSVPQQPPRTMRTRAMDGITKPKKLFNLNTTSIVPIPKTPHLALSTPEWYDAMQNEFSALIKNETWELVPRCSDMNIIRSMWLFKHKFRSDGSLERYKARLVCDGRSQQVGVDCGDTFSPVVKPTTIRTVLTLALSKSWPIHQLDVTNAFLHGHLQETVYMHQPMGFRHRDYPDHVCRLKKSLYGLKQAPRAWYQRFTDFVLQHGFTQCKTDNSLFIYHHGHDVAYLLIYVDDIILTTSSDQLRQQLMTILAGEFAMKDLGPLSYFLGISVTRTGDTLFLSQHAYAKDIIHRAGMDSCKPAATPVDTQSKLASEPDSSFDDPTTYRSLAGALQYLTFTRPDIAYAVQQICMHMHSPCMAHWNALKRILRYLQGTADYGLHLRYSSALSIRAYTYADWAGCPDTRRSTSGYCVYLGDNLISWSSKRQSTISRSSAEAEYRGVANVVAEICWLRNLLLELHRPLTKASLVYSDNVSAIYLSGNPVQHQRTKHIELDIHFVREHVQKGLVRILHMPSRFQIADIFTKGLPRVLFDDFRSSLSIRSPPASTAGV